MGSQWGPVPPPLPSNIMGKQASRWGSNSSSGLEKTLLQGTSSGGPSPLYGGGAKGVLCPFLHTLGIFYPFGV